jgi:hypothetical protein
MPAKTVAEAIDRKKRNRTTIFTIEILFRMLSRDILDFFKDTDDFLRRFAILVA